MLLQQILSKNQQFLNQALKTLKCKKQEMCKFTSSNCEQLYFQQQLGSSNLKENKFVSFPFQKKQKQRQKNSSTDLQLRNNCLKQKGPINKRSIGFPQYLGQTFNKFHQFQQRAYKSALSFYKKKCDIQNVQDIKRKAQTALKTFREKNNKPNKHNINLSICSLNVKPYQSLKKRFNNKSSQIQHTQCLHSKKLMIQREREYKRQKLKSYIHSKFQNYSSKRSQSLNPQQKCLKVTTSRMNFYQSSRPKQQQYIRFITKTKKVFTKQKQQLYAPWKKNSKLEQIELQDFYRTHQQ